MATNAMERELQFAGMGTGLSFRRRRTAHGAPYTAAHCAHPCRREALRTHFCDEHEAYCRRTSRLIPGLY